VSSEVQAAATDTSALITRLGTLSDPRAAAFELARVPAGKGMSPLVAAAERDARLAERVAAAIAIGLRAFRAQLGVQLTRRGEALVRAAAPATRALRLRGLARDRTLVAQLDAALSAADAELRAAAAFACEALGDAGACADGLRAAMANESDAEAFRREASAALALRVEVAPEVLRRRFDDRATAPEAMLLAASAQSAAGDAQLGQSLRRALRAETGEDLRSRAAAALGLGLSRDRAAVPALLAALRDPADAVHTAALRVLAAFGGARIARELQALARIEPRELRWRGLVAAREQAQAVLAPELLAGGDHVLTAQVATEPAMPPAERPEVDVFLSDGRVLRLRCSEGAELWLPGLPATELSVRLSP
jgi:hypothetical protein